MNVVRLAVSAGSLTLAVTGGLALDAPPAHAAQAAKCTGLLGCTTKNVGDTVGKVGEGDLEGTVQQTGKTVGDAVDGVEKTVTGGSTDTGGTEPKHPSPPSPPRRDDDAAAPQPRPGAHHGGEARDGTPRKKHRAHASGGSGAARAAGPLAGSGDTSRWVSLQQWQGPRLPLGQLRGGTDTTTTAGEREVPPPEVAEPPATNREPTRPTRYLSAVPAAEATSPAAPEPLPAGTVFAATTLAGTVGVAVLSVYQRRRQERRQGT